MLRGEVFGKEQGGEGVLDGCSRGVEEFAEWLNEWGVVAFLCEVFLGDLRHGRRIMKRPVRIEGRSVV